MDMHDVSVRVKELWNGWELRAMILLSLYLQILLIIIGNRRKYTVRVLLGIIVWLAYLSADWVATVSLGILARAQGDSDSNSTNVSLIPVFWAPILLVHLGGPDTITAYSVEDNELWLRKLLELLTQVIVAFYVLFRLWSKDNLPFVAIPIFVAGIIKYAERIQALRLASYKKFRSSTYDEMNDPEKVFFNLHVSYAQAENFSIEHANQILGFNGIVSQAKFLHEAHFLFQMFKPLYSHLFLPHHHHMTTYEIMRNKNATEAFKLIEVELGFVYDVLYTKARKICSSNIVLRSISFLSFISALMSFSTINKHAYSKIDSNISYVLLVGAIFLEIYSAVMLLFSDWALLLLSMPNKPIANFIYRAIGSSRFLSFFNNDKRWSGSIAQHDLISVLFTAIFANNNCAQKLLRPHRNDNVERWEKVGIDLKEIIFDQLLVKRSRYDPDMHNFNVLKQLLSERGDGVLQSYGCLDKFHWSVVDVEFHHSLLTWHLATSLCYHIEFHKMGNDANNLHQKCKMSKSLSDYMLYLLIDCPLMLPEGIVRPRYSNTRRDIAHFIYNPQGGYEESTNWGASNYLLQHYHSRESAMTEMSVLPDGCKLARSLQSLETEDHWSNEQKWEMITKVWVEILTYAACHCGWKEHAQALTRGGELLTHVCLLMAHLGLSERCRIGKTWM